MDTSRLLKYSQPNLSVRVRTDRRVFQHWLSQETEEARVGGSKSKPLKRGTVAHSFNYENVTHLLADL